MSKGIPLAELLTQLLANASDPKHPLKWANADGIILVSTPATLKAYEVAGKALQPDKLDEASGKLLDQRIHEVKFDGVPLGDAIDFIKDVTNAPLEMDWKAVEAAGVDRKAKGHSPPAGRDLRPGNAPDPPERHRQDPAPPLGERWEGEGRGRRAAK